MQQYKVPVRQFCVGAQVEFVIPSGGYERRYRTEVGTVKHLIQHGDDLLAVLSRTVSAKGVVREGACPTLRTEPTINLDHATHVVEPGTGPLTFAVGQPLQAALPQDLEKYRQDGTISRCGQRLVIKGEGIEMRAVMYALVADHISRHRNDLSLLPWELLDFDKLMRKLLKCRILSASLAVPENRRYPYSRGELNTVRLNRFITQNINRFKLKVNRLYA